MTKNIESQLQPLRNSDRSLILNTLLDGFCDMSEESDAAFFKALAVLDRPVATLGLGTSEESARANDMIAEGGPL